MYVEPTPFALTSGTAGLATLILPEEYEAPNSKHHSGTQHKLARDYYNNHRIKAKRKGMPSVIHRQQALSAT